MNDAASPRRFVIISSPRSGTHMLRTTLDAHSRIVCLAEVLNPDLLAHEPHDTTWSTDEVLRRHVYKPRIKKILAHGFAVHRSDAPLGPWTDVWEHLLNDSTIRVVMLHRHHLLRRYLSFIHMRERNRSGDPKFEPAARSLDADDLRREFLRYEQELADFRSRFAAHPKLQVSYEDLCDRFTRTTLRLQRFLGVPIESVQPRTDRNRPRRLEESITNLPELNEAFRGSRWEWFFTPERRLPTTAEDRMSTDRAAERGALLVRAPPSTVSRRGAAGEKLRQGDAGKQRRRNILAEETALYTAGDEELVVRDFFQDQRGGIFVEIGAGHPIRDSVAFYLEKHLGWLGLAVDAWSNFELMYREIRPRTRFCRAVLVDAAAARPMHLGALLRKQGVGKIDFFSWNPRRTSVDAPPSHVLERHRPRLVRVVLGAADAERRESLGRRFERDGYEPIPRYETSPDLYLRRSR